MAANKTTADHTASNHSDARDTARTNHHALFGDRASSLTQTDPELIAYFNNFAFDEVIADAEALDPSIDLHTRVLVQLAAVLSAGGVAEFRVLAAAGVARARLAPVELKELVYQAVAYVGMARTFDYLHAANDVLGAAGVPLPLPPQAASTAATRLEYGKSVQAKIAGGVEAVEARFADAPADTVHFQRYLAANCFGDTVGRGGIDLRTRELITFALLTGLGGVDAQLRGHVSGNLDVGNTRATLLAVLTVLLPYVGYPRTLNALAAIDDVCPAPVAEHR
jgi:4-carboxymuconolactone decarboxylase